MSFPRATPHALRLSHTFGPRVLARQVISEVGRVFGLPDDVITGPRQDQKAALARHVGMHVARRSTALSLPQIARIFGRNDHTTVLNALGRVAVLRGQDRALDAAVRGLEATFDPQCVGNANDEDGALETRL